MSFRKEEKLYIKSDHILEFKNFLRSNSAENLYKPRVIKSLYFDNLNFDMYNDSIEGIVPRKKIRVREYPEAKDSKYFFEIKHSSVEGRFKTRKVIKKEKLEFFKKAGCFDDRYGICFPNFYVSYNREYLIMKDVRISIDTNIIYQNFRSNLKYSDRNCIVELKTSINKNNDDLINDFPFQRIRFSKYCFAVESFNYR